MDKATFNNKLRELIQEITNLPVEETKKRHKAIKDNIDQVAKSLIDLRICLKYLLFDLEATRRERDALKAILNKRNGEDDKPNKAEGEM